jgi:hypothetical protein
LVPLQVVIIVLDIALLVVEYQDRHVIEQALKQVVYSVKLKFEFAILSKLAGLTGRSDTSYLAALEGFDDFLNHPPSDSIDRGRSFSSPWLRLTRKESAGKRLDAEHLERGASGLTVPDDCKHDGDSIDEIKPAHTADQKKRRRTLEDNLYAGACRDLAT